MQPIRMQITNQLNQLFQNTLIPPVYSNEKENPRKNPRVKYSHEKQKIFS